LAGEAFGAAATEQQMRRTFNYGTRQHDRIAYAAHEDDATGVDLDRVGRRTLTSGGSERPARVVDYGGGVVVRRRTRRGHHGGVHLDAACSGEDGAIASIEERIVFEGDDRRDDRIEGRAAASQNVRTALHGGEDSMTPRGPIGGRRASTGTAVSDQRGHDEGAGHPVLSGL